MCSRRVEDTASTSGPPGRAGDKGQPHHCPPAADGGKQDQGVLVWGHSAGRGYEKPQDGTSLGESRPSEPNMEPPAPKLQHGESFPALSFALLRKGALLLLIITEKFSAGRERDVGEGCIKMHVHSLGPAADVGIIREEKIMKLICGSM